MNETRRIYMASELMEDLKKGIELFGDCPMTFSTNEGVNRQYLQGLTLAKMPDSDKLVYDVSDTGTITSSYKGTINAGKDGWFNDAKYHPTPEMCRENDRFICLVDMYPEDEGEGWIRIPEVLVWNIEQGRWLFPNGMPCVTVHYNVLKWRPFDWRLVLPKYNDEIPNVIHFGADYLPNRDLDDGLYLVGVEHLRDIEGYGDMERRLGVDYLIMLAVNGEFLWMNETFGKLYPTKGMTHPVAAIPVQDTVEDMYTWTKEYYMTNPRGDSHFFYADYRKKLYNHYLIRSGIEIANKP